MFRLRTLLIGLAFVWASGPALVHAQIYAWQDANGHWVLSDKPGHPDARTFEVQGTRTYRTTVATTGTRSAPFEPLIDEHATRHGVSPDLVRAVIQAESAFNPRAVSVKGAMGLMQLMPATAADYDVVDPYDPAENIRAGVAYLKKLLVQYSDDVRLALAAYNAGPGAVARYGMTVPPYRETRQYVEKITSKVAEAPSAPKRQIYKTVEIVNGRPVVKYTSTPVPGSELVTGASRR
jgi:soluble lytic murein transglycosylase-like protein